MRDEAENPQFGVCQYIRTPSLHHPYSTSPQPQPPSTRIMTLDQNCIFCKIIKGEIPSLKLFETEKSYAFLDIQPTARGHALIIPKYHGAKLHDIPDPHLADILPVAKKIAIALGAESIEGPDGEGYNILQNNGRIAHQVVDHVHFHVIPKKDAKTGLIVGWPQIETNTDELKALHADIVAKIGN